MFLENQSKRMFQTEVFVDLAWLFESLLNSLLWGNKKHSRDFLAAFGIQFTHRFWCILYQMLCTRKNVKWTCFRVIWKTSQRKKCLISEIFWSVFSCIWTEYGEMLRISPYSVQMRENTDQKNSEYEHFSSSVLDVGQSRAFKEK